MKDCYTFLPGDAPMLISVPHAGTRLSPGMAEAMMPEATCLPDTDWFVDRLYEFAGNMGVSILRANFSRYVIDLNRPPDGTRLYPGRAETELCATTLFDGRPVYQAGREPGPSEIDARKQRYWQPYHEKLQAELNRLRAMHHQVILWDAHSIRSEVPRLFDGRLPDLNFGTADGASCASGISADLLTLAETDASFRAVLNGRFKGGYITRHYGSPARGIHGVQLEIAQSAYMDEATRAFDPDRAVPLTQILRELVSLALKRIGAASSR